MKKLLFVLIFVANCLIGPAQNLLNDQWKFTTGDDSTWMRPEFDDSKWANARIGELWENWGFPGYDGYGWYRKQVVIPSTLKKAARRNGGLTLKLARIDDVDFTWFNGNLMGKTGEVPPNYLGRYDVDRIYTIPVKNIRWDMPNTIAVRVYDHSGGGGIYGSGVSLTVRGLKDMVRITPAFQETDRVIKGVSDFTLPFEIKNESRDKINGLIKVLVLSDFRDTIAVRESTVQLTARSKSAVSFPLKGLKPGIYLVTANFSSSLVNKQIKFNFAIDPEKMTTITDVQPDFAEFWSRAKQELASVDPHYKLTKVDSLGSKARDCYLVEMHSLGNVLIRAWLMTPKKPGKYPAVLTVQGYSSVLEPDWTFDDDGVVSLGLNIRGHGNSRDDINPGFPGYLYYNIEDREKFIYRGAYMDCVRAVDFLFSRSEVDTARVAVEGGSQGGALSFATAALCGNRIRAAVPAVPFLSDFPEYMRVATWPANEWNDYANAHPQFGISGILNTLSYFDIKNLAPRITAPVFMGVGLVDETCPPRINFAAYNNLKGEKKYEVFPLSGHGLPVEFDEMKIRFLREQLEIIRAR